MSAWDIFGVSGFSVDLKDLEGRREIYFGTIWKSKCIK